MLNPDLMVRQTPVGELQRIVPPVSYSETPSSCLADLVAFRADPITCPVDAIPSLRPAFTIVGGRAVYDPETVLGKQS